MLACWSRAPADFSAAALCGHYSKKRATVHGVSRHAQSSAGPRVHWWRSHLDSDAEVERILASASPDIVFHLAGQVSARPDPSMVLTTFESLLASTVRLLAGLGGRAVQRVVLVGSLTEPPPGTAFPTPGSPYVAAKWAASAYGRMFHTLYGTPVVVIRPGMTYGPGQPSQRLLPSVLAALAKGEAPRLTSGLLQADWVFLDDVVDALCSAGRAPRVHGATIDVGSGESRTARDVVIRLVEHFRNLVGPCPDPVFGALPDRPIEQVHPANVEVAWERLGWHATTSLDEGLRRTITWYWKGQRSWQDVHTTDSRTGA